MKIIIKVMELTDILHNNLIPGRFEVFMVVRIKITTILEEPAAG
jgi:hypothetical protein